MTEITAKASLLESGVSLDTIDTLESLFSLSSLQYRIHWPSNEDGCPTITLACPKCGSTAEVELDAVTDFWCPEDQACGYDFADSGEKATPLLG